MELQEFNIASNSNNYIEVGLSNLSYNPFVFNGVEYASIEAFWQSLKFEEGTKDWQECIKLFGKETKIYGNRIKQNNVFNYNGVVYIVGSEEHQNLMKQALRQQLKQNEDKLKLLLSTGNIDLIHRPKKADGSFYPDSITIPGEVFSKFLIELREEFKESKDGLQDVSKKIGNIL